jgi:hypothetical protein
MLRTIEAQRTRRESPRRVARNADRAADADMVSECAAHERDRLGVRTGYLGSRLKTAFDQK